MVRLAQLSDVHVTSPRLGWQLIDWASKRLTSWVNDRWLGRRRRFLHADRILACLIDELPKRKLDHLIFSGDATALGFETEFRRAAEVLQVGRGTIPGLAVPGNHDYCTRAAAASGWFEHYFAPWQDGVRVDGHRYPFAQRAGDVWLVGVNAAHGNQLPWDASGRVGADQLARLRVLLGALAPGPRVLVIHYPVCLPNGRREAFHHGLRDLRPVLEVAAAGGVGLWLHGHRHAPYWFQKTPFAPFPVICAGTTTEAGIWSYNEYSIHAGTVEVVRRTYDPVAHAFRDAESFALHMPAGG